MGCNALNALRDIFAIKNMRIKKTMFCLDMHLCLQKKSSDEIRSK